MADGAPRRVQMKYMMLLVDETEAWEKIPEAKRKEIYDRIGVWWGDLSQKGKLVEGHQLQPTHPATTVKHNRGTAAEAAGPVAGALRPGRGAGSGSRSRTPRTSAGGGHPRQTGRLAADHGAPEGAGPPPPEGEVPGEAVATGGVAAG